MHSVTVNLGTGHSNGQFGKWLNNARDWSISRNRLEPSFQYGSMTSMVKPSVWVPLQLQNIQQN